jgi:hypothetical protein
MLEIYTYSLCKVQGNFKPADFIVNVSQYGAYSNFQRAKRVERSAKVKTLEQLLVVVYERGRGTIIF